MKHACHMEMQKEEEKKKINLFAPAKGKVPLVMLYTYGQTMLYPVVYKPCFEFLVT